MSPPPGTRVRATSKTTRQLPPLGPGTDAERAFSVGPTLVRATDAAADRRGHDLIDAEESGSLEIVARSVPPPQRSRAHVTVFPDQVSPG